MTEFKTYQWAVVDWLRNYLKWTGLITINISSRVNSSKFK